MCVFPQRHVQENLQDSSAFIPKMIKTYIRINIDVAEISLQLYKSFFQLDKKQPLFRRRQKCFITWYIKQQMAS